MQYLLEHLEQTVNSIKDHPWITINEKTTGAPASASTINSLETVAQMKVPENLKAFYSIANGFSCVWSIRQELDERTMKTIAGLLEDRQYDFSQPLGTIRLLPLEKVFFNEWQPPKETDEGGLEKFEFGTKSFTYAEFGKMLKPFDIFYPKGVQSMAFLFEDDTAKVMMLDDYNADWQNSRTSDFETYIQLMCDTRFTITSRNRLYGKYRGDKDPELKYEAMNKEGVVPALFK